MVLRCPGRIVTPIGARWHSSGDFDFGEGLFRGSYGGYNYLTNEPTDQAGS